MKRAWPAIFLVFLVMIFSQAKTLQAAKMPTTAEFTNTIQMKFVRIPRKGSSVRSPKDCGEPGTLMMGWDGSGLPEEVTNAKEFSGNRDVRLPKNGDYDEPPMHKVAISKPFYMGICEVTNEQYEHFDRLHSRLRGYLSVCQARNGVIYLVTSKAHYAFNLKWLETPPPCGDTMKAE